ncbi:MAG: tetratricopeptide repeat protein [Thermoplasmata archaeon]
MGFLDDLMDKEKKVLKKATEMFKEVKSQAQRIPQSELVKKYVDIFKYVMQNTKSFEKYAENFSSLLNDLGYELYVLNQYDASEACFEQAIRLNPKNGMAWYHKALILTVTSKNLEEALVAYDRALEIYPKDKSIWTSKGDAYRLLGRTDEAVQCYLKVQELDPLNVFYFDRILKLLPDNKKILLQKGITLANLKRYEEAIGCFDRIIELDFNDCEAWYQKANVLVAMGKDNDALAMLENAIKIKPTKEFLTVKANILKKLGRIGEALDEYNKVLEMDRTDRTALCMKGDILLTLGRIEEALEVYEVLTTAYPDESEWWLHKKNIAKQLGKHEIVISSASEILRLIPNNIQAMLDRGFAYLNLGKTEEALNSYAMALEIDPTNLEILQTLRGLARTLQKHELLVDYCNRFLTILPEDREALLEKASALDAMKKNEEALRSYQEYLKIVPNDLSVQRRIKEILKELGRFSEVYSISKQILQSDPTELETLMDLGLSAEQLAATVQNYERERYLKDALVAFEKVLEMRPDYTEAAIARTRVLILTGDFDKALELTKKAVAATPDNPNAWYMKGRAELEMQMFEEAAKSFSEAIKLNPEKKEYFMGKGLALMQIGRFEEALSNFEKARNIDQSDPEILYQMGEVMTKLGRTNEAVEYYTLASALRPDDVRILLRKGQSQIKVGRLEEGLVSLMGAMNRAPQDVELLRQIKDVLLTLKRTEDVIEYCNKILELAPDDIETLKDKIECLISIGKYDEANREIESGLGRFIDELALLDLKKQLHVLRNEKEEALRVCNRILMRNPQNRGCWLDKARLLWDFGRLEEALAAVREAIALEPNEIAPYFDAAKILLEMDKPSDAINYYDGVLKIDGENTKAWEYKGDALIKLGKKEEALLCYEQAVKVADNADAFLKLGKALQDDGKVEEAIEKFRSAIAIMPDNIEAWKALGNLYMLRDDFAAAKDAFEKVVRTGKADWETWYLMGRANFRTGLVNEAIEYYEKALQIESRAPVVYMALAEIYASREKLPEAVDCYAKVLQLNPDYKEALQNRALLLEKLGRYNEAISDYDRLIGLEPENKYVWNAKGLCLIKMERYEDALRCFERALEIDREFAPAFEGRKTAQIRMIEKNIESYARKVLEYEYQVKRRLTKKDMFVECKIPFNMLDHVATYLSSFEHVELSTLSKGEIETLDKETTEILRVCIERNPDGIARNGIMLSDIVMNHPNISVQKAKKIMGFIMAVEEMDASKYEFAPEIEALAREAMRIPPEKRTLFNLAKELNTGIFKAKILLHHLKSFSDGKVSTPIVEVNEIVDKTPSADANSEFLPSGRKGTERCMICNGLADILHDCGAPVCILCAKTYGTCPKCGRQIVLPRTEVAKHKESEKQEKKESEVVAKREDAKEKEAREVLPPPTPKPSQDRDIGQL